MPNISVIIPAFNGEKYLKESIDSVLNQTYQDFELIIVDDGSTDNSTRIINEYITKYNNKIIYFYQKNTGVGSARNTGLRLAKGNYYSFLDQDDYYYPLFLELSLKCLVNNNYDFVIPRCYQRRICSENKDNLILYTRDDFPKDNQELYKLLFEKFVGCIKMLAKRSCFDKCGYFDENFFYHDDWDLWVRFIKEGLRVGLVPELTPLWVWRIRSDSLSHSLNSKKAGLLDNYNALLKHKNEAFNIDPDLKKTYGKRLFEISKSLFHCKACKIISLKIFTESQAYYPNINNIIDLKSAFIKRLKQYILH